MKKVLIYPFLLGVLTGCLRPSESLKQAEACMQRQPDSALTILRSIAPHRLYTSGDKALYALLLTQAQDKNSIPFPSDSLINIATDYYDESEPERAGYAWLYKSRYANQMETAENQSRDLCEAQRYAEATDNFRLKGLIYADKADLYKIQGNPDSALLYNFKAYHQFRKDKDLSNLLSDLCSIADLYRKTGRNNRVFHLLSYMESLRLPPKYDLYIANMYLQCGSLSFQSGHNSQAMDYFKKVPVSCLSFYNKDLHQLLAKMYLLKGKPDSALYHLQQVKSGKDSTAFYAQIQMEIYQAKGDWRNALMASQRMVAINDSVYKKHLCVSFAGLEKKYNYQRLQLKNQHLQLNNKHFTILLLILILTLLGSLSAFLWWRNRVGKELLREHQITLKKVEENRTLIEWQLHNEEQLLEQQLINNRLLEMQLKMQKVLCEKMEQYKKQVYKLLADGHPWLSPVNNSLFNQEVMMYVDIEYNGFTQRLKNKYPGLSENNVLICCLILAGFDSGMIAVVQSIQLDSVNKRRYRIRMKMGIETDEKMLDFLRKI